MPSTQPGSNVQDIDEQKNLGTAGIPRGLSDSGSPGSRYGPPWRVGEEGAERGLIQPEAEADRWCLETKEREFQGGMVSSMLWGKAMKEDRS